jgi:hypothetical protein
MYDEEKGQKGSDFSEVEEESGNKYRWADGTT